MVPQPSLAESWDFSADVKYNLLHLRDPKNVAIARSMAQQSSWWTQIDTPDKYTVVLASDLPRPGAFDLSQYMNIVDKDVMETPDAATRISGTGPFKFVEWMSGDHFTSVKNPNY